MYFFCPVAAQKWKYVMEGNYWLGGSYQTTTYFKTWEIYFREAGTGAAPVANAGSDLTVFPGTSVVLSGTASGGNPPLAYHWTPLSAIVSGSSTLQPTTIPLYSSTPFNLLVTDLNGCTASDQVQINVYSNQNGCENGSIINNDTTILQGNSMNLFSQPALTYHWHPSNGINDTTLQNPTLIADASRTYYLLTTRYSNNLIMNSDFEQGNTGFFTTYTYCNSYNCLFPLADYGYAVGTDASFFHVLFTGHDHTSGTGNFMIINGARPSLVVWRQTIQINPNTNYAFGVWISTMIARSTAQIRFSINGSQLGNIYYAPAVTNQWDQVFTTWNSGTSTSAVIEIVDVLPVSNGNDFGLDDVFFGEIISCIDSIRINVIQSLPVISFSPCFDTIVTTTTEQIKLKGGLPLGGIYTGDGVNSSTGFFNPSLAGTGLKTITYTYTNSALQSVSSRRKITVLPSAPFNCGSRLTDIRDNKTYPTILIGTQCWLAANLNYGTMISSAMHQTDNCIIEKYCYNEIPANCAVNGGYYQWDEMMQYDTTSKSQGICPTEWHLPSHSEWSQLIDFYTGNGLAADSLKHSANSMFNALLSGNLYQNNTWRFFDFATFFWTSSSYNSKRSVARGMNMIDPSVSYYPSLRTNAFFVRCIHDNTPVVTTSVITNITQTTASGGGIVLSDGGNPIMTRGVCWGTLPNPTIADSHTMDGSGLGAFVSNLTGLTGSTLYYVRAYGTTIAGTCYGNTVTITTSSIAGGCNGVSTLLYGGKTYNTIQIGNQCWFRENLNIGTRINGAQEQTDNSVIEKYCYNDLESNCDIYGGLYQWAEMVQYLSGATNTSSWNPVPTGSIQGICPTGWHIPNDAEWCTLTTFLDGTVICSSLDVLTGTNIGQTMKEPGTVHWASPNAGATNSSGFTALPGGGRYDFSGIFLGLTTYTDFRTASPYNTYQALDYRLEYNTSQIWRNNYYKIDGMSVRCVKN